MNAFEIVVIKPMSMTQIMKLIVPERRKARKCIACGESEPVKREVCNRCHGRFQMNRPPKANPVKRARYEAAMQAAGKIGGNRQGQKADLDEYRKIVQRSEAS